MSPQVKAFFDEPTFTVSYVVSDPNTRACAVIDSVLDYDPASGRTSRRSADDVIAYVRDHDLTVEWILETHVHADHLSAGPLLRRELGGKTGIGRDVTRVQGVFSELFNSGEDFRCDGTQFDQLFDDGDVFSIGGLKVRVLHTPGHTPACVTYVIGDAAFVGDTLFMPDFGTARTDFPGGDAGALYDSIRRILALPADTRLFMCHDYKAPGRSEYRWETTVREERERNIHVHDGVSKEDFVLMRERRDRELDMPRLLLPSVQVNMRGGDLPPPEDNGVRYLKIPVDAV
jgi:glyoxylase-like metal-dependent hydrolase (beta-lactamase superfamily II)